MRKIFNEVDTSFYRLASEVTKAIETNKEDDASQKEQVEELLNSEIEFKKTILKYEKQSTEIYKKFLQKICIQNKNILSARPYFREKAKNFSKNITPSIKAKDIEKLKTFDINFQLIRFIRDSWLGPFPKKAEKLYQRVKKARTVLIENNMPLAINRAKLFFRKTPKGQLSLMDMIGICSMGLSAAVDKYCGPYTTVFRAVIIGRCVGCLIDEYSDTVLHFFPNDKRILYKAHSIRGRQGIEDPEELAKAVNESFKNDKLNGINVPRDNISASELSRLMSAASTVSSDATVDDEGYGVYSFTPDSKESAEENMIHKETKTKMLTSCKNLSIIHRKILKLKGLHI